jgi:Ca2+-binding EF-hand superfamily protein
MSNDEKIKVIFEKYDKDKNGVLDRGEFKVVFKTLLHEMGENIPEKKHDQVVDEAMETFDTNKNGIIEYNEFVDLINFLINEKGYILK